VGARFTTLRDAISRRQDSSRQHDASPAGDGPLGAWLLAPSENILSSAVPFLFFFQPASFLGSARLVLTYLQICLVHLNLPYFSPSFNLFIFLSFFFSHCSFLFLFVLLLLLLYLYSAVAGHVARIGERRSAYRVLVGKPEGKRPLPRLRHG
jgi:hypothetical protein